MDFDLRLLVALVAYVAIEVVRYIRLQKVAAFLQAHRTPLSKGFDREEWGRFMLRALKREAPDVDRPRPLNAVAARFI